MKHLVPIALSVLLVACQSAFINGVPNENSPYFSVPVDSKFVLRKAVTVPAQDDSVFFENGRVVPWSAVNVYGVSCWLKFQSKRDTARTIEPDEFVVKRVHTEPRFRIGYAPSTQLAALDERLSVASIDADDSDSGYQVLATIMTLQSTRQTDVSEMVCVDWQLPQGMHSITVRRMRATLGEWFNVMLAPSSP